MTKGILINAETKTVTEVEFEGLKGMYAVIGCELVEVIQLAKGVDLWVDEEGRCKNIVKGFMIGNATEPIMGNGLVAGSKNGETADAKVTVEQIAAVVRFVEFAEGEAPEPEMTFVAME